MDFGKLRNEIKEKGISESFWHVADIMRAIRLGERRVVVHETFNSSNVKGPQSLKELVNLSYSVSNFTYELIDSPLISLDTVSGTIGIDSIDDAQITHSQSETSDSSSHIPIGTVFVASVHGEKVHSTGIQGGMIDYLTMALIYLMINVYAFINFLRVFCFCASLLHELSQGSSK